MATEFIERRNSRAPFATKGFTMIELVVVIILLGILAATALPRFIDIDSEAHAAVVDGVGGGLQTGVALFHAKWVATGEPAADSQIDDFSNLRTNIAGYPYGLVDNSGGTSTVTTSADCLAVYGNVLQSGAPTISSAASLAATVGSLTDITAVAAAPNCLYYYTAQNNSSGLIVPVLTYDSVIGSVIQGVATLP